MKKELLSPAGDFESLKQAIHNGCDAIYLGGKEFGARKFASNFDKEEMIEAIHYCHLYGVKIYVTVNTLITESEVNSCLEYITFLHEQGVDAVIMQDMGMIMLVRWCLPNLDIHVSTQAHTHNINNIKLLESIGVKRVVLAREMTIDEINKLDTTLELETFIHGAICVSYSGQCLFSSLILDRSGNRGECAGICRLPFELLKDGKVVDGEGKYLLSPKELNTTTRISDLMESNIMSFKIEGRMKNPATVGYITRLYRKLIDNYENCERVELTDDEVESLKMLFNRGFTEGHIFSKKGKDLMNIKTPNHIGVEIGKVIDITPERIRILLHKDLNQEDGIRFLEEEKGMMANFIYDKNDKLTSIGRSGEVIEVDNKIGLTTCTSVVKTTDSLLIKRLNNYEEIKIPVKLYAKVIDNERVLLKLSDYDNEVSIDIEKLEKATGSGTSSERIKDQLLKFGNSPFVVEETEFEIEDGLFVPISKLNELRRSLIEKLIYLREYKKKEVVIKQLPVYPVISKNQSISISVLVRNEEQLKVCLDNNISFIYVDDYKLYEKYKSHKEIYYRMERVKNNYNELSNERLLIGEVGSLYFYKDSNQIITDYFLNVSNHHYIHYLLKQGVKRVTLSVEVDLEGISSIVSSMNSGRCLEVIIYGRIEVMVMKYCPVQMLVGNDNNSCQLCKEEHEYLLKDRNGEKYPIRQDKCLTHIFNYRNMNRDSDISKLLELGIENYRIELFDETVNEVEDIIKKYQNILSK